MRLRMIFKLIFACVVSLAITAELSAQQTSQAVLVHYMPWYASKPVSGHWGWHWTMNHFDPEVVNAEGQRQVASHDYPLIGPYDSGDTDALECQVQLMKMAGIDGVILDWYGIKDFRDYQAVHQNSQRLIGVLKKAGLRFAVCYEDQSVKHMVEADVIPQQQSVAEGQQVMRWLDENWFADPSYVTLDDQPVLLVFGPQFFSKQQWERSVEGLKNKPLLIGLPHLSAKTGMNGSFGWPPVSGGKAVGVADWHAYMDALLKKADTNHSVIPVVFPGFRDIYQEAGLHESYGSIDDRSGQTFIDTFKLAKDSGAKIVQIATWNDYGEGTVIEPTARSGYRYLEFLQKNIQTERDLQAADLHLPIELYRLRKEHQSEQQIQVQLQKASELLLEGESDKAAVIIMKVRSGE